MHHAFLTKLAEHLIHLKKEYCFGVCDQNQTDHKTTETAQDERTQENNGERSKDLPIIGVIKNSNYW